MKNKNKTLCGSFEMRTFARGKVKNLDTNLILII